MHSSSSLNSAKERFGFLLFAAFIVGLVFITNSGAVSAVSDSKTFGDSGQQAAQSQSATQPQSCSTCAAQGSQTLYAPLIALPESSNTEINLNCRSPHVMQVTPTFYTREGEALVGEVFQMQPAEVKTLDLGTLMPRSIRNRQDLGGMTLSYTGGLLEMWAQLRLMNVNQRGSVDVVSRFFRISVQMSATLFGGCPSMAKQSSRLAISETRPRMQH